MSLRGGIVLLLILFIIIYAQRNWFGALCVVVAFTALVDYPGLPNPFQEKGLNHWSAMVAAVILGWGVSRIACRRPWDLPRRWKVILGLYLAVELLALTRLCINLDEFRHRYSYLHPGYAYYTVTGLIVDEFYGPVRYMFLGFLLFEGARTRNRLLLGLAAVLCAATLWALVVDKETPLGSLSDGGMYFRHRIQKWTGRHPNDLATVLVAGFWLAVATAMTRGLHPRWRVVAVLASLPILLALAHTRSRGGYLGFVTGGIAVAMVYRSWKIVGILACAGVVVVLFAPSVTQRILEGVDAQGESANMDEVTGGRDVIWAAAIPGILESPAIGHGQHGYILSRAYHIRTSQGSLEGHPHSAYLEALLDHGVLFAGFRLAPYVGVLLASFRLAWKQTDPLFRLVGLSGFIGSFTYLVMGLTGQHFGLTENLFVFWCLTGLVIRAVHMQQSRLPAWPSSLPGQQHVQVPRLAVRGSSGVIPNGRMAS